MGNVKFNNEPQSMHKEMLDCSDIGTPSSEVLIHLSFAILLPHPTLAKKIIVEFLSQKEMFSTVSERRYKLRLNEHPRSAGRRSNTSTYYPRISLDMPWQIMVS